MKNKNKLPPKLMQEIESFFYCTPPVRLSRNLRKLLTSYLILAREGEPIYMEDLYIDLENLFELLDVAGDELAGVSN